jgi:hypothetical protein
LFRSSSRDLAIALVEQTDGFLQAYADAFPAAFAELPLTDDYVAVVFERQHAKNLKSAGGHAIAAGFAETAVDGDEISAVTTSKREMELHQCLPP